MTRLLALVSKPPGIAPGQRFRLEQWAPLLEAEHGIRLEFRAFESPELMDVLYRPGHLRQKAQWVLRDTWRRRTAVTDARGYDGVVIFREAALLGPAFYERLIAWQGLPLIVDFDDAIWIPIPGANGIFTRLHFAGKTSTLCRLASAVSVGNAYLADYARQFSSDVFVVPTTINLSRYPSQPTLADDVPFTIVWSGSKSTLAHLDAARPALERLGTSRRVVLRVICNQRPEKPFANVETVFVPWREEGEAEALRAAHVGIMPLPDTPFTRGKCALKGLQYMAVGLPVVLSPVGVNSEVVNSDENGLLADSADGWVEALERLAADPALRRRLGAAGRKTVEDRYSSRIGAAQFAGVARQALQRRARSSVRASEATVR